MQRLAWLCCYNPGVACAVYAEQLAFALQGTELRALAANVAQLGAALGSNVRTCRLGWRALRAHPALTSFDMHWCCYGAGAVGGAACGCHDRLSSPAGRRLGGHASWDATAASAMEGSPLHPGWPPLQDPALLNTSLEAVAAGVTKYAPLLLNVAAAGAPALLLLAVQFLGGWQVQRQAACAASVSRQCACS